MMNCEQARKLFDAYLNGELAGSLATEFAAHRVRCGDCRRALAILQVTGHVLASDDDETALSEEFTDRLLACTRQPSKERSPWRRRILWIGGPLATAAAVALVLLGVFHRRPTQVAGERSLMFDPMLELESTAPGLQGMDPDDGGKEGASGNVGMTQLGQQLQDGIEAKRQSGKYLQEALDVTVLKLLNSLDAPPKPPNTPAEPAVPAPSQDQGNEETEDEEDDAPSDESGPP